MRARLAFIDTLRGFAVISVLLQHCIEQIVISGTTGNWYWFFQGISGYYFNFGRFGVVLFFFVSGFVIPFSFPDSRTPIRDFVISRFFRLYPTYWLSVFLGITILPITESKTFSVTTMLANLTMFQSFVNIPNVRTAYWTLAIELIFYASCIALFFAGFLKKRMTALYIVLLICVAGGAVAMVSNNHLVLRLGEVALNLAAMFFGKVTRDAVIEQRLNWKHVLVCTIAYCATSTLLMMKLYGGHYDETTFFFGYSMAAAYVVAGLVFLLYGVFGELLSFHFMSFVGRISYSIYLMHAYVLTCILYWWGAGSNPFEWLRFIVVVGATSLFVSWVTFKLIETPSISFGHKFRSRSRHRAVAETSS